MKKCIICGCEIPSGRGRRLYCAACRNQKIKDDNKVAYQRRKKIFETEGKKCVCCGKWFVPSGKTQIYCTPECRKKFEYAQRKAQREADARERREAEIEAERIRALNYMPLHEKNEIAKSYGLTYGKMSGLLAMAGLQWREHKKLGLKKIKKTRRYQ